MSKLVMVLLMLGGCLLLTGCETPDDALGPSASTKPAATSTPSNSPAGTSEDVRLVAVDDATVVLGVSNQSFDDPEVNLTVTLDGVDVVEQSFAVEGQHTVTSFGFDLAPGVHTLKVVSDTGATTSESFELPADEPRWIYVDYWYLDPAKEGVTWGGDQEPGPALFIRVSDKVMPMA